MRERLKKALEKAEGYVEIRVEDSTNSSIAYRNGEIDKISAGTDVGGCVRALAKGGGWGLVHFNSLDNLEKRVEEAIISSKAIQPEEPIELAKVAPVDIEIRAEVEDDPREHSLEEKHRIIKEYDEVLRGSAERLIDTSTTYGDSFSKVFFANTEGSYFLRERMDVLLAVRAMARDGDNVQSGHDSWTSRSTFANVKGKEEHVAHVGQIADQLLDAEEVKAGKYTVILDPRLAGVFIHEAFGHLSESDHIMDNPQAREMMELGRRFGPKELNVIEDGTVEPALRGTIVVDDEGVMCKKNYLIKDGVLVGRIHNRETAAKMGEELTGNARAQSYLSPPIVRMTNTAIENGTVPFEDMIADIELGVYCIDSYGGQTMVENFSFSAGHGFMIRDGKIAEMVRNVVLQGNLFQTLMNIEAIGNDFVWAKGGGNCGKGGQLAKVSFGSPHIRIKDVIIGGR
ncbi:MAG TPA: TldD/PmbA family protein [candidate division Zixibacteria bacterium]|nr:TldD/PmbA family protein [candidate division Zixibacteria bacterium]